MATYLTRFSYTPETWQALLENPEDRRELIRGAVEKLGGTLQGFWFAFGENDGYLLVEAPDHVTPAALSILDIAGGFVRSMETTVLVSVEETLDALRRAKSLM